MSVLSQRIWDALRAALAELSAPQLEHFRGAWAAVDEIIAEALEAEAPGSVVSVAHWPGQDIQVCERHKPTVERVAEALGFPVSYSRAPAGSLCEYCAKVQPVNEDKS